MSRPVAATWVPTWSSPPNPSAHDAVGAGSGVLRQPDANSTVARRRRTGRSYRGSEPGAGSSLLGVGLADPEGLAEPIEEAALAGRDVLVERDHAARDRVDVDLLGGRDLVQLDVIERDLLV